MRSFRIELICHHAAGKTCGDKPLKQNKIMFAHLIKTGKSYTLLITPTSRPTDVSKVLPVTGKVDARKAAEAVEAQFEADLKSRVQEARDIFRMNKVNITRHARKARRE